MGGTSGPKCCSKISFIDLPVDDPKVRRPDILLAEQRLGWRPSVPSAEGLRRTVEWFAAQREPLAARAG
ncbi:hypothetical protein [Modestobacter marinus]|uniref:hypothetical protein n=1 Tax=Modestobacter marinus TaxID=477641 RepID=UPI0021BC2897|nr:hypothetical protein [Modestobacter marinus]